MIEFTWQQFIDPWQLLIVGVVYSYRGEYWALSRIERQVMSMRVFILVECKEQEEKYHGDFDICDLTSKGRMFSQDWNKDFSSLL